MKWHEDKWNKKAKKENYLARSVYKLSEIEKKENLFKSVRTILDLGAAPGSWTQYCVEKLPKASIVAVDLSEFKFQHPNVSYIKKDIFDEHWVEAFSNQTFDLVLSDVAPKTSGLIDKDVQESFELSSQSLKIALKALKPTGSFLVKIFMGHSFDEFTKLMKTHFMTVKTYRPEATRGGSKEIYFIGKNLKL